MPFKVIWTEEANFQYEQLKTKAEASLANRKKNKKAKASREEGLFKQVHKSIVLLVTDPKHPGLHTHEYSSIQNPYSIKEKVFEAYAQNNTPGAYRVFWCYGPKRGEITILTITPHP